MVCIITIVIFIFYFTVNKEKSNILFVFDDICKKEHYDILTFAKKAIIISQFQHFQTNFSHSTIPISVSAIEIA